MPSAACPLLRAIALLACLPGFGEEPAQHSALTTQQSEITVRHGIR